MPKILAIDDISDNLISLKAIVHDAFPGSTVFTALNGPTGIELAIANNPDVILLDVIMPGMDGFEVCRRLKLDERVRDIPVVFLTALKGDKENRIKALEVGVEGFISKPIDETELTAQIRAMVKIKVANEQKRDEKERLKWLIEERTLELEKELEERKRAESELKESEERFKLVFEASNVAESITLISGEINVNQAFCDMFGYTKEELKGKKWQEITFSDEIETDQKLIDQILKGEKNSARRIKRYVHKNGSILWADASFALIRDHNGKPLHFITTIIDITERKLAEDALRESEFFFKESQRAAFVGSYKFDLIFDFWTSSEILEQIFGIDKNYSRSLQGWLEIIHPDDQEMIAKCLSEEVIGKRKPFNKEYRIIRKSDGETRWVLGLGKLNFDAEDRIIEMLGTIQDITERKQVEETLVESEEKYSILFNDSPDSYLIITDGIFTDCNRATELMLRGDRSMIVGKVPDALSPEFQPDGKKSSESAKEKIEHAFRNGKNTFEWVHRRFDGSDFYVEVSIASMTLRGKPTLFTTWRDITERKEAEEKIKASEERYRSFISQVSEGVYRLECDVPMNLNLPVEEQMVYISDHMILAECNEAFVNMYGAGSRNEIIGKAHPFFHGNPNKPVNCEALLNFIMNGYRAENAITEEVNLSSQKLNFSNNSIGIIENNQLVRIWGTQTDITEKIKADQIQEVLYTISNAALSSVSLPKLIEIISNEIGKLLDSTNFYIAFYDEKTNMLSTIYEKDEKDVLDTWPAEKSITGYVIKKQKSLFVKDFEMEALVREGEIELFGTLSKVWLGVPLMMDQKAIGAVVVQSYDNPEAYNDKDKQMLEFVSHQISISIERKRAEQKLKLLNRAIDQSSVSIVITNKDGLIEFTNPKFTEASGYLPEEVMGKNPSILKSGKHSKKFYLEIWHTLAKGNAWNGEICNKRKNGTLYWENVYISPVEGEDGEISHYVGIKEDINEKKLLEETQRITMEISQISITKTSLNSFLKEVHQKLNKIMRADNFYLALYDKLSDTYTLAYHVDEHDQFEIDQPLQLSNGYTDLVRKTGIGQLITTGTRNNPENKEKVVGYGEAPSAWLGVPLRSSSESEVIGVIAIQDYKNLNAYTKLEYHTLEVIAKDICVFIERIKNLEDLTKAKERAEESDRLKTAFLANMSHEIRTPLNSIVGFADLMLDPDFDREQYADFARIINNSGNSLLAIISDIMDISKIEAGQIKVHKTNFSVSHLIRQIHKQHSFVAVEKGLELKINVENDMETLLIESDENRVRQVLVNFVGNAIKFTLTGYVEIGAKVQANAVLFHVKDTGIGIPQEYHTEIFDRFRQVEDADTRKYGGNGLGLAISKNLVELLGGKIEIESEQGKGSTFYFTVPLH